MAFIHPGYQPILRPFVYGVPVRIIITVKIEAHGLNSRIPASIGMIKGPFSLQQAPLKPGQSCRQQLISIYNI